MALGIWKLLSYLNRLQEFRYRAVLVKGEQKIEVTAILDTGNQLHDPVTGAAVNILCKTVAKELWDQEETGGCTMDSLSFCGERRRCDDAPPIRHDYASKERKYNP